VFAGLVTLDVIHQVDVAPRPNEKVTARAQEVAAGGPATNAAVTFAALGGEAVLVTALGTGAAAQVVRGDLEARGVRIVDLAPDRIERVPVSSIVVVVGTGERSVVSVDASTGPLDAVPNLDAVVAGADVVLVDGHHPALAAEVSRAAAAATTPLALDAGRWRAVMHTVIPRASAVICSADFRYPAAGGVLESARALRTAGVATVIVTRGADPVLWWHDGQSGDVPAPRVDAVDTAGAGDVLHGAYCYYADEPHLVERIGAAARVAALKCRYPGTRSWLDHLSER
jgi:sugar/nucleoside kinase (ribokinase family)